jgi:hypothetical protein
MLELLYYYLHLKPRGPSQCCQSRMAHTQASPCEQTAPCGGGRTAAPMSPKKKTVSQPPRVHTCHQDLQSGLCRSPHTREANPNPTLPGPNTASMHYPRPDRGSKLCRGPSVQVAKPICLAPALHEDSPWLLCPPWCMGPRPGPPPRAPRDAPRAFSMCDIPSVTIESKPSSNTATQRRTTYHPPF